MGMKLLVTLSILEWISQLQGTPWTTVDTNKDTEIVYYFNSLPKHK